MLFNDQQDENTESPEEAIANWLRSAISRITKDQKGVAPKSLKVFLVQETGGTTVDSYEIVPGTVDIDSLAMEIHSRAQNDAMAVGGGAYFIRVDGLDARWAISFAGPNANRRAMAPYGQGPQGMQGGPPQGMNGYAPMPNGYGPPGMGGPPGFGGGYAPRGYPSGFTTDNPVGILFQAMVQETSSQRDNNARLLELAIGGQVEMMRTMRDSLKEANETVRVLERERRQNIIAFEEIHSRKHERDMEHERQKKTEERKDKIFEMFEPLALSVAARFFGGKGVPAEMAPLVNMLNVAFRDMDGERLQALVASGLLKEHEVAALLESVKVLQQIHAEKEKSGASDSNGAAMNGTTNT